MAVQLRGARVLLTGATGGIGAAIARVLHARGAEVILTGRRVDILDELAAQIHGTAIAADLSDAAQVRDLLEKAGPIDVLVNNAALPATGAVAAFTEDQLDQALDVNLRAPIMLTRAVTPDLVKRGDGHIVFIGSMAGRNTSRGAAVYNTTKFAIRGFALAHRQDLHGTGVGVSVVEPSFVSEAGMFVDSGASLPFGIRTVTPDAVARAVIRSIEKDEAEIVVAPVEQKLQSAVGLVAPSLSAWVQRALGVDKVFSGESGGSRKR